MQSLWSRVACRCNACAAKAGIARHTATTAGRRPTGSVFSVSNFWYGTVFAIAASSDAMVKEERNEQWDKAIADMKEGVNAITERTAKMEERLRQAGGLHAQDMMEGEEAIFERPELLKGGEVWPESTGNPFRLEDMAPQSLWASPWLKRRWAMNPWTPKKLHLTALSMDKLTIRTVLALADRVQLDAAYINDFSPQFQHLLRANNKDLEELLTHVDASVRATKAVSSDLYDYNFSSTLR